MIKQIDDFVELKPLSVVPLARKQSLGLVFIIAVLLYSNTFSHEFVMDDHLALVENNFVTSGFDGLYDIWTHGYAEGHPFYSLKTVKTFRPVTQSLFAIIHEFFQLNASAYHITQVLVYAALCCLLFVFLDQLFGKTYPGLPLLSTLLFVLHPLHTEVVANVKSMDELLSLTLTIASAILLVQHYDKGASISLLLGLCLYLVALLSKETPITFIASFPLAIFFFRESKLLTLLKYGGALTAVAMVFLFCRWLIFKDLPDPTFSYLDNPLYLAEGWSQSIGTRLSLFGKYLWLMIAPIELTSSYFYDDIKLVEVWSFSSISSVVVYLVLGLIGLLFVMSRSPLIYGICFYFISISIFSNLIIQLGNAFGERLSFTPSLGFCLAVAALLYKLLKWGEGATSKLAWPAIMPIALIAIIMTLWSVKSVVRNAAWKNNTVLVDTDLKTSPRSHVLNTMKVQAVFNAAGNDKDKIRATLPLFARALELNPRGTDRYGNYGFAYYKLDEYDKAIPLLESALRIRPEITDYQLILALCYAHNKQIEEADSVTTALLQNTKFKRQLELTFEVSQIFFEQEIHDRAIYYGRIALENATTNEDRGKTSIHLGNIYFATDQLQQALNFYSQTIEYDNNNVNLLNRTGNLAMEFGQNDEAIKHLTRSLEINAANTRTHALLNKYYLRVNDAEQAKYHEQEYLRLTGSS